MEDESASETPTLSLDESNSPETQALESTEVSAAQKVEGTSSKPIKAQEAVDTEKKKKKKKKKSKAKPFMPEAFFPWKVMNMKNRGRCAVATRVIKPGEVVVAEHAVAFVPRVQYRKAVCHICGIDLPENAPQKECSSCKYTIFCEKCNKLSEVSHQKYCLVYKEIDTISKEENCDADLLRLVFNLALKKPHSTKNPEDDTTMRDGVVFPSFQDALSLETHQDKATAEWLKAVKHGCIKLHKLASTDNEDKPSSKEEAPLGNRKTTVEDLELLAALVNTNAHGMGAQGLHNTDVALGIFPFVSMLNHSCRPNCCFASEGSVLYVRAVQDIPKGAELCVSYINLYEPRSLRKSQLAATKHFDCHCERCSEPLNTSMDRFLEGCVCPVKGCGGVMIRTSALHEDQPVSATWVCDLCSRVLDPASAQTKSRHISEKPWELVAKAEEKLVAAVRVYSERRFKEARQMLEDYLSEFTGKLHQLHVLLFDALTPLMNCCRALGNAEEGLRVCRLILQCMERVLSGPSLELANFYFCLGEMHMERTQGLSVSPVIVKRSAKQAQEAFQRVKSIREICLGKPGLPA